MRLIDADALMKDQYIIDDSGTAYGKRLYVTFDEIENAPTIEPEQKKGKWIDAREYCSEFMCSNCHRLNRNNTYNFCPDCGARMED